MHSDNPASRLLNILKNGKEQDAHTSCRAVWSSLLGVGDSDQALLLSRLGKVMELPNIIINQIKENYPNQVDSHSHWSETVNTAFMQQNLNGLWHEFIVHIDYHTINYLSMSADLLDMKSDSELLPADALVDIRGKVNGLLTKITESNTDQNFKKYLVRYLHKILIAIDEYHISGAIPISECIESTFGHMLLDKDYRHSMEESELGKQVVAILGAVASVVTVAVGLPQLSNPFQYMLENPK